MENDEIKKQLAEQMKRLDACDAKTPELSFFLRLVKDEIRQSAKRRNIQFTLFILISGFIVAGVLYCLFASAAAFALIQIAMTAGFCLMCCRKRKEGVPRR
ncbi:MAG: DUF5345 family protein [Clostridia bacterium]|nr:DUF5345 family protein [Clostridia bacterium]